MTADMNMNMNLSHIFASVVHKELVPVDLPDGSNQHEINGNVSLKDFFGTDQKLTGKVSWHYFADDQEPLSDFGDFSFYDARAKSSQRTGRSEWRFYYYGDFLTCARPGDVLVLAKADTGKFYGIVFQRGSSWLRSARVLFGFGKTEKEYDLIPHATLEKQAIELSRQQIINELDLDIVLPIRKSDEDLVVEKFGAIFPKTVIMSAFARSQIEVDISNGDDALTSWLQREEELFRALEKVQIEKKLKEGFHSVDEFISYSLSIQNRRKSRMGQALQNQLGTLFSSRGLKFTAQAHTEGRNKPDFIFPGEEEYHAASFSASLLIMLGVKSSSKDRWRQILPEADRIPDKHLCTLEPGISTAQTDEMKRQRVTLVLPAKLHPTYSPEQLREILTVNDFIEVVRRKQS